MHLTKVLPLFFLPVGFSMLLMLTGTVLGPKRRGRWFCFAGIGVLLFCSLPVIAEGLIDQLQRQYPPLSIAQCPRADAILILGGMLREVQRDPELPDWNDAVDRFEHSIALYRAGKASKIILTSGAGKDKDTEGTHLRRAALAHGIPADAILCTARSGNTEEEAAHVAALASQNGIRSIVLVTSAFHMSRAMLLFERTGLKVTAFPVDYYNRFDSIYYAEDYLPDADALVKSQRAFRELFGLLYYAIRR